MFELIKKYYKMGIYTDANLDTYVKSRAITAEQAEELKTEKRGAV